MIRHEVPTITEFLLARIAEDEAGLKEPTNADYCDDLSGRHYTNERVLAECAAKRALLGRHEVMQAPYLPDYCSICAEWDEAQMGEGPPNIPFPCDTLKHVASVYSDHPDYQHEWEGEE